MRSSEADHAHPPPGIQVEAAYAVLRTIAGLMFAFHGVQKIFGVLTQHRPPIGTQLWFGGLIELVCGSAIAAGLFTPWVAFLASGTMAVAYVQFHWKLGVGTRLLPAVNQGELALLYSLVFLLVACRGGGAWSLDSLRVRRAVTAARRRSSGTPPP